MNPPSEKICPACAAHALIQASTCQQCGHAFRTKFAPPLEQTQMYQPGINPPGVTPPQGLIPAAPASAPPANWPLPPGARRRTIGFPRWVIALGLVGAPVFLWIGSTTADFMAEQSAGRDAYADKLSAITGDAWGEWRRNAEEFGSTVDGIGRDPATVTISGVDHGRKVRIGVAIVERVSPWHWRPVRFTPDMPPYPTLPQ